MKSGNFARSDNKPLTLGDLKGILNSIKVTDHLNKPIIMSSDEEGNDMLKLWSVDVSDDGEVTLWPAHY